MTVQTLVVGDLQSCCYIVSNSGQREVIVIDPGDEGERIAAELGDADLVPELIIDTHGHGDHIGGNAALKKAFPDAQLCIHPADADMLTQPKKNLSVFLGFLVRSPEADRLLEHGDRIEVGSLTFEVRHVPGHTDGGIVLYHSPNGPDDPGILLCGDAVFAGSVGRTDFPGGDWELLLESIRGQILSLPDNTIVYPGHGPTTTVGEERSNNPFLS